MIDYEFKMKSINDLTYKLYDTANQFNREKFEKTCLKNRLKRKKKKK